MKVLVIANFKHYQKYMPVNDFTKQVEIVFLPRDYQNEELLKVARDAAMICIDPISHLDKDVIDKMDNLKIVQSDGVGFNRIDLEACRRKGIYVCNCKGANAASVAEQTILLMLALLRNVIVGNKTVLAGHQIDLKEQMMVEGIVELGDCKVGLIGFGDIGKATAKRLIPFDCQVVYYDLFKASEALEQELHVTYEELDNIAKTCDIISIHCPVTAATTNLINEEFLKKMKPSAYLVNTARGEIIDNSALAKALINNQIKGAALDTIAPEPVTKDHILLNLPIERQDKLIFSPHIGGVTSSFFKRAQAIMWHNLFLVANSKRPLYIVNKL